MLSRHPPRPFRPFRHRVLAAAALAGMPLAANATLIADSVSDFSGVQGAAGWYYGSIDPELGPASFTLMPTFDGERWFVDPVNYWTMLGPLGGHANGNISSGSKIHEEQWAVRRWISPYDGELEINAIFRKLNVNPASNGVMGRIFQDGVEVWSQYITGTDATGLTPSLILDVSTGTTLDFILDPYLSNDWSDNSQFSVKLAAIPAPGAAGLAIAGAMFAARRRR